MDAMVLMVCAAQLLGLASPLNLPVIEYKPRSELPASNRLHAAGTYYYGKVTIAEEFRNQPYHDRVLIHELAHFVLGFNGKVWYGPRAEMQAVFVQTKVHLCE